MCLGALFTILPTFRESYPQAKRGSDGGNSCSHSRILSSSVVLPSFTKHLQMFPDLNSKIGNLEKKWQLVHTKIYQVSIEHDFQLFQFFITEAAILPVDLPQLLNQPMAPEMGPQKNGRGYLHLQDLNSEHLW